MAASKIGRLAEGVTAAAATSMEVVLARATLIGVPAGAPRALHYGCGIGIKTAVLATRFDEVVGIDPSPDRIDSAQLMYRDVPRCTFMVGGPAELEALPASFGFAFAELGSDPGADPEEAERVTVALVATLVPGGVAAIKGLTGTAWQGVETGVAAAGGQHAWLGDGEDGATWLYAVAASRRLQLIDARGTLPAAPVRLPDSASLLAKSGDPPDQKAVTQQ